MQASDVPLPLRRDERKSSIWPSVATLLIGLPILYVATLGYNAGMSKERVIPAIGTVVAFPVVWLMVWIANRIKTPAARYYCVGISGAVLCAGLWVLYAYLNRRM